MLDVPDNIRGDVGFAGALLGIASALAGDAIQIVVQIVPTSPPGSTVTLGWLLLFQGYLLLPIMEVSAFLLSRCFDLPSRQNFPESPVLPPGWKGQTLVALACGSAVLVSFVFEATGW